MDNLQNSLPSKRTSPEGGLVLTGPLKSWLLDEPSDAKAIEVIGGSAVLLREAEALMPELRQEARRPATVEQIKSIIGTRFALFPQPERTDGEWDMWWADYIAALEDLTPAAVEAGMAAWVKSIDAEFMPKPGKLRGLAKTSAVVSRWTRALDRIRKALPAPEAPPVTPPARHRQTAEELAALMADFHKAMKAKAPPPVSLTRSIPPPCAAVDDTGMSAEMRALFDPQKPARAA